MNLHLHLKDIIANKQLTALFQPIYSININEVYGYEALIRGPSDSPLHNPQALFDAALEYGLLSELELVCRSISIARFVELSLKGLLFLNVSPMVFLQSDHPQGQTLSFLNEHGLAPSQVVIELSEKYPIDDPKVLRNALIHYRDLGFQIAVDDLGTGYAGLKLWSEVKPDFVKIDRYFINQCDQDPVKREFIKSILQLGQSINATVVAEGIETENEFKQLDELGIDIYQGFLFARPALFPPKIIPLVIQNHNRLKTVVIHQEPLASSLLQVANSLNYDEVTKSVVDFLHKHPHVHSLPVVKHQEPIGMVLREHLLELFSTPFGRSLNEKKPIFETMYQNPVMVEAGTPLEKVAQLVTSEHDEKLLWHFIITDKGRYVGIGSVRDLLRQLTQQQIQHARYANPLSLLPGNVPIYRHVDELLKADKNFYVAYFDLNNFKPFNDIYGYAKGDLIIQLLANLLQSYCLAEDFIGHIGGDDFIVIFKRDDWQFSCQNIINEFERRVKEFYEPAHLKVGGIKAKSRSGKDKFYPLLGLAIGVVQPDNERCYSHHDVAELASAAKKQAKNHAQSHIFFCRRGGPENCCQSPKQTRQVIGF